MKVNRHIFESLLSLSILQGANQILHLLIVPYLVRVLGPEHFGMVSFSQAFIQYFILLTDYGFNLSATRSASAIRHDRKKLSELFWTVMAIKAGLLFLSAGLLVALVFLVPVLRSTWMLHLVVCGSVVGHVLFPVWFYQGIEKMRYIAIFSILAKLAMVTMIFAAVRGPDDYLLAAGIQSGSFLVSGLVAFLIAPIATNLKPALPSFHAIKLSLSEGWHVFLSTAAVSLYTTSNTFVVGLLTSPADVGYFSASEKLIRAVLAILSPVSQSVYPHVNHLAHQSKEKAILFLSRLLRLFGSGSFVVSALLIVGSDWIVSIVFGPEFGPAVVLLRWMAFLPFVISISNVLGIQTMLTFGFQKLFSDILIFAGILNIALIFPMTIILGVSGAAISVLVSESAVVLLMFISIRKRGIHLLATAGVLQ
jgi:PST family polysaccharide transporter